MPLRRAALALGLLACSRSGQRVVEEPPLSTSPAVVALGASSEVSTSPSVPLADAGTDAKPGLTVRRQGAYANLDPDDDLIIGPPAAFPECETELAQAGVKFKAAALAVHKEKGVKLECGAPQVVTYLRGPGNIAYSVAPLLTCSMALALATFERILQKEATTIFGSPVARIDQIGTYSCREIAAYPGLVSDHAYANAIDLTRFVLKNGASIEILRDFDLSEGAPRKPAGAFLRVVSQRANDEDVFSHVLTPFFNASHRNHFHLDLARYRNDGTRPQTP